MPDQVSMGVHTGFGSWSSNCKIVSYSYRQNRLWSLQGKHTYICTLQYLVNTSDTLISWEEGKIYVFLKTAETIYCISKKVLSSYFFPVPRNEPRVFTLNYTSSLFYFLRQGLTKIPKQDSNLQSSCSAFQDAGITSVYHHVCHKVMIFNFFLYQGLHL